MANLITFRTSLFDPAAEPENPYNPIAGQSALVWVRAEVLGDDYESSEPDAEDWGWYTEVVADDEVYTVGAICFDEEDQPPDEPLDWMIQVVKRRRFADVMRRRGAMSPDDRLTSTLVDAFEANPAFEQVSLEVGR